MVEVVQEGRLEALVASPGWQAYYSRDYASALGGLRDDASGLQRVHAELSALYRQGLLAQSRAILETFGTDQRRAWDPPEADYLLGVAHAVLGDLEEARLHLGKSADSTVPALVDADALWAGWLAEDDFALGLREETLFAMPEVSAGQLPQVPAAPHYRLPEGEEGSVLKASDPTWLLQLAAWHEEAAASVGEPQLGRALVDPWRLPSEKASGSTATAVPLESRFLGGWATPGDLALVRALQVVESEEVATLVGASVDSSLYGAALAVCLEENALDYECVLNRAHDVSKQLVAAMEQAAGAAAADHREFAAHARLAALRVGARIAEALGDSRTAGLLWIAARDQAQGSEADPLLFLRLVAWDSGNRNPHRAQELLHPQISRAPGLDGARYALDSLYLRVSRDAGGGIPMP
jgi:hypothetical protein